MSFNEIKHFMEQLQQLPTLPPIGIKLLSVVDDEDCSIGEVAGLIESDPALTSKILKIANSLQFGMSHQVTTVRLATSLLGIDLVRSVALSIMVFDQFKPRTGVHMDLSGFWQHSLSCAIASELLASRFGYPDPKEAFVAGLLHDLGKLIFLHWNPQAYQRSLSQSRMLRESLLDTEEAHLGMGHTQAAKMLMDHWQFPSSLSMSAWLHHQPPSHFGPEPHKELPFVVKCANNLCHHYRLGNSGNTKADFDQQQLQQHIGITEIDRKRIIGEILQRVENLSKIFDWEGSTQDLYVSAVSRANQELGQMQVDLTARNHQLAQQQAIMASFGKLQEELTPNITPGKALEPILNTLQEITSSNRLMGFVLLEEQTAIEGRLKTELKGPLQSLVLSAPSRPNNQVSRLKPRELYSLVEKAIMKLDDTSDVHSQFRECLSSRDLVVLPLETSSMMLGQIIIELADTKWNRPESKGLLSQYAREAALVLERIVLIETLTRQAEDLARRIRKEQKVRTQLLHAQQLASIGRLAAGAAHEINNPLAAISLQVELLLKEADREKDLTGLQLIVDQSARIARIIDDLMGFARPSIPRVEPTNIPATIDKALGVMANRIKLSEVEVQKDYQDLLPLINADPTQLEQVVLNLIVNAIQAMNQGGILTIRVGMDDTNERLSIEFNDTGIGIQADHLPVIFDPFFTTKKAGKGTGLGLSICHSFIKNHNGQIEVSSRPDCGTTFTIFLPLEGTPKQEPIEMIPPFFPEEDSSVCEAPERPTTMVGG